MKPHRTSGAHFRGNSHSSLHPCLRCTYRFRNGVSNEVQYEIGGEVGQHRRFKAILPEEIAEGDSSDAVEEDGTHDQQGGQLDQAGSSRQMTQARSESKNRRHSNSSSIPP